jgi:hypothetical protein
MAEEGLEKDENKTIMSLQVLNTDGRVSGWEGEA